MKDKAEIVGRVAKVDGRTSEDPDGSLLDYKWRLLDAPETSAGTLYFDDGTTGTTQDILLQPDIVPYNPITDPDGVDIGDYVLYDGVRYEVLAVSAGQVTVDDTPFPSGATELVGRIFKSSYIQYRDEAIATVVIDVVGQYLVQLEVFDGLSWSIPDTSLIDGREWDSVLGEVIDGEYMWNYLSDVYSVVNEREYITEFFAGATQMASDVYLKALQTETGVSLQNIQPYFYYRWLAMNQIVKETNFTDQSFTSAYGEIYHRLGGTLPSLGDDLEIRLYTGEDNSIDVTITLSATPTSWLDVANEVNTYFIDAGYPLEVDLFTWGANDYSTLKGSIAFEILGGTLTGIGKLFSVGQTNWMYGTNGLKLDANLYQITTSALLGHTLRDFSLAGHFLVVRGESYPILSVESDNTDPAPSLRLVLGKALPDALAPADLATWAIPGFFTSAAIDWEEELVFNADVAHLTLVNAAQEEDEDTVRVVGVSGKKLGVLTSYPENTYYSEVLLSQVRRYGYCPLDDRVFRIPKLQEIISGPEETLTENVEYLLDYYRGRRCIIYDYFNARDFTGAGSPIVPITIEDKITETLWAEHVITSNKQTIEDNFGARVFFDAETYEDLSDVEYLASVRGLWFIFSRGKTIENLTRGMYIFFALPFSEQAGTIEQIAEGGDSPYGRIFVRDDDEPNTLRTYIYNKSLGIATNPATGGVFVVGDHVDQFTPLVEGIEVQDWLSDPEWFAGMLASPHFMDAPFYEIQKYHKFMIQIDSEAYTVEYKDAAQSFVDEWRPRYLLPIFVIYHKVEDTITIEEHITWEINLRFIDSFCSTLPYLLDVGLILDEGATPPPLTSLWSLDDAQFCPRDLIDVELTWLGASGTVTGEAVLDTIFFLDGKGPAWILDDTTWLPGVFPYTTGWITIYPW